MHSVAKIDFILKDFAYGNDVPEVFLPLWLSFKNVRLIAVLLRRPPCGYRDFLGGKGAADFVCPVSMRRKLKNPLHNPLRFLVNDKPVLLGRVDFIADWHDRGDVFPVLKLCFHRILTLRLVSFACHSFRIFLNRAMSISCSTYFS